MHRLAALLVLALASCGSDRVLLLDAGEVALAMFFRGSTLIEQQWAVSTDRDLLEAPDEADALIDFRFRRSAFSLNGAFWLERPPEILLGAPEGTCRRCYAPQGFSPQIALPGEACPMPPSAIGEVHDVDDLAQIHDPERIRILQKTAFLRWPGRDDRCLRVALIGRSQQADTFEAWLRARSASVARLHGLFPAQPPLTPELLADFDVIVLFAPDRSYDGDELTALHDWVAAGGGLITLRFAAGSLAIVNTFLDRFGLQYTSDRIEDQVLDFADHPAVRGVTSLDYLDGALVTTSSGAIAIATIDAGTVGMAAEIGRGRVVAWGDEDIHLAPSFDGPPDARVLWANLLSWVAHEL